MACRPPNVAFCSQEERAGCLKNTLDRQEYALDKLDAYAYNNLMKKNREHYGESGGHALPRLPCACAVFRRASRAMTRAYERALRGTGLNISQFTLLQALAHVGPITQGRLGRMLALDRSTLHR